jgi:hypothetical protein
LPGGREKFAAALWKGEQTKKVAFELGETVRIIIEFNESG